MRKDEEAEIKKAQAEELQWGRNMRVAESSCGTTVQIAATTLQWGRNMRVAESITYTKGTAISCAASMGPQHESCGKS